MDNRQNQFSNDQQRLNSEEQQRIREQATYQADQSGDAARPDLNVPERTTHRVPDMNEDEGAPEKVAATGAGTLGGAAVGAVLGSAGGPPGAVVGGVIGGLVGGIAGNDIATPDQIEDNDRYWRDNYQQTAYYRSNQTHYPDLDYDRDYQSAYRLGYEGRQRYRPEARFDDVEQDMKSQWEELKAGSRLTWEEAKFAVKDAWDRMTK